MTTKARSKKRFEQLNRLVDVVLPSIPKNKGSHRTILLFAFRHASPSGGFVQTKSRIAKCAGISIRQVRRTMKDLESWGLIVRYKEGDRGPIHAFRITYMPCKFGGDA
jgi:predicted transcriptional regulator